MNPKKLTDRALPEVLPPCGALVLESHHSPEFTMEWRTHSFIKLVYVLSGRGTFYLGGLSEPFSASDVIVVKPGTRNRIEDDPTAAASLYVCCISQQLVHFDPPVLDSIETQVVRRAPVFAGRIASTMRRMVHVQEDPKPAQSVSLVADALTLIQSVVERPAETPRNEPAISSERLIVQSYIDSLPTRFFDETTIDAAAGQLGIPRRTFTKLFAEIAGETWLRHIRSLAIDHARRRLQQTGLSITSVAFECGFNDLSTFYRQFKTHCGVSPGEYRASLDHSEPPIR
ncbi:MAG: helix-turn-helix domain-containing protein [Rubripirellula sp.]